MVITLVAMVAPKVLVMAMLVPEDEPSVTFVPVIPLLRVVLVLQYHHEMVFPFRHCAV
jgi:hypothetical protein